jgi:hypothetical protein
LSTTSGPFMETPLPSKLMLAAETNRH